MSILAATQRVTSFGLIILAGAFVAPAAADPPPWAPAHGWRAKNGAPHAYHYGPYYRYPAPGHVVYQVPYGIDRGYCDRPLLSKELVGGVVGGAAGGVIGHQFGKGSGKVAATIGGAVIGALVGSSIGRTMDVADQHCVGYTLEHAPDKRRIVWDNPDNGYHYAVTPTRTFERDGRYCREYETTASIGGRPEIVRGTACRQPDGSWQIVS